MGELFQKKNKYKSHLAIIKLQLEFMCTLFSRTSPEHIEYFRKYCPEEVVLNYLKMKLHYEDKLVFLKIINEVYLRAIPRYQTNIISSHSVIST